MINEGGRGAHDPMLMKQLILIATLLAVSSIAAVAQSPVYQLRIYKLHPGNEAHFHDRFRDQCIPIMKRYGFDIVFTSQSGESGHAEFVYLLRWKDRATQVEAWKKFLSDEEWIAIKKASTARFGDLVDDVQDRSLDMLPYSPAPSKVP
jgi:heme-degrading monooxygenase HmoA